MFQLLSGFFGLTQTYRAEVFRQIHEIVFFGKGGYSWSEVYNMPIWLRNFTYSSIKEYYDKEREKSKTTTKETKKVKGPDISPSYTSKASQK